MGRFARQSGRGFTIVEVIVVCLLIAILATLAVPRFAGFALRRADASVREFAELLSLAAAKDQITARGVAVEFDGSTGTLRILSRTRPGSKDDPTRPVEAGWWQDTLTRPVTLDGVRVASVMADGIEQDPSRWRIEFPRTEPRPRLSIVLETLDQQNRWGVVLSSGATRAQVVDPTALNDSADVTDLDASGKAGVSW